MSRSGDDLTVLSVTKADWDRLVARASFAEGALMGIGFRLRAIIREESPHNRLANKLNEAAERPMIDWCQYEFEKWASSMAKRWFNTGRLRGFYIAYSAAEARKLARAKGSTAWSARNGPHYLQPTVQDAWEAWRHAWIAARAALKQQEQGT